MSERQVTMSICPHCDQPVQPSLHTTVQCLDNMRAQRDEARDIACKLLHIAECRGPKVFGPRPHWLKEQPTVDE